MSALLFGGTILLFSRAVGAGFVNYDDPAYVTDNPHVQGGLTWAGVVWAFTSPADYWHPLTWLSHMLDWRLYGNLAAGHHLTSVLWHGLNAVLVLLVLRRLGGGFWPAGFAAAVFAWHPLRVESVAWVAERKDVISGCFFLLTLLAHARYADARREGRPARAAYGLTLACFAAGLASKPMLVTLPLVLLVLDWWPLGRGGSAAAWRRVLVEKIPFFVLSAAVALLTVLMQRQHGAFVLDLTPGARAGNALVSVGRYLGKFGWPRDLIVCYPHPGWWPVPVLVAAALLVGGISWLAWAQRRTRPWLAAGWLWFLVALLPASGLVQVGFQAMADRYTYLPLLGVELALLGTITPWVQAGKGRAVALVAAPLLLAALAVRTWEQQGVWQDPVTLFGHAVAASKDNGMAEDFLASALFKAMRYDEAAVHGERACALDPRSDTARITLAGIRHQQGRRDDAIRLYREALGLRPGNAAVQMELGALELAAGHFDEARALMMEGLRRAPQLRDSTRWSGQLALQLNDLASARVLFEAVLSVAPDDVKAQDGLGKVLVARGDVAGALAAAPGSYAVHYAAAEIAAQRGDFPEAIRLCRRATELAPGEAAAHAALGYLLNHGGDRAGARVEWQRALELDASYPGLREQLGNAP